MRLDFPLYPGGSLARRQFVPDSADGSTRKAADSGSVIVHGNIDTTDGPVLLIDFAAIEDRARAERDAWIRDKLNSLFAAFARKFARGTPAGTKDHLAA